MDISYIAPEVRKITNGLWRSPEIEEVSYTKEGHSLIRESETNSFWFQHRLNLFSILFKKYRPDSVLDVGGGNGQISKLLQSMGIESVLVEPRIEGVKNALHNGVRKVIHGSVFKAKLRNASVPSIVLFDVLEHIEDDLKFLNELNRILEPGGKIFITVPAFQFLYSDFDKEVGHFRRYNLKDLSEKLDKTGFLVCYGTYFFYFLPFFIYPIRKFYNLVVNNRKRRKFGHIDKQNVFGRLIKFVLLPEQFLISKGIFIPVGSTCFVLAQKKKNDH